MIPEQMQQQNQHSDDDMAAALGFITTLGEQHHMAQQGMTGQEDDLQESDPEETKPAGHEANQDKEIQDIKDKLNMLLRDEENTNGTETTDTGTTK